MDTNALLRSLSRRSPFAFVLDKLYEGEYELWVSNVQCIGIPYLQGSALRITAYILKPFIQQYPVQISLGLTARIGIVAVPEQVEGAQ